MAEALTDRIPTFEQFISPSAIALMEEARALSEDALEGARLYLAGYLARRGLNPNDYCFAVAGSYGRREALGGSDFDLLPIAVSSQALSAIESDEDNRELRKGLSDALEGLDVSRGRDLMKAVDLHQLIDSKRIGGDLDGRSSLTQRVLALTEAAQAGGSYELSQVRRSILAAYAIERTAGRHPLAFCNDLARYYRTVCIDYRARVDIASKDWATRNVKLRHARKLWYFTTLVATSVLAESTRPAHPNFTDELLRVLAMTPIARFWAAVAPYAATPAGQLLEQYAWYLKFMADPRRREELAVIEHDKRYDVENHNPYPGLQWNAKVLQSAMMDVINSLTPSMRDRILEWFLL